jgi:hypothetical protein
MVPSRRMHPLPRVKLRVSRRQRARSESQNRVERRHRVEPPVEAKHVFVQIRLQVVGRDTTVVSTKNPSFQIGENKVNHRQVKFGFVRIATKDKRVMGVSHFWQIIIFLPSVGANGGTYCHIFLDERGQVVGALAGHDLEPESTRLNEIFGRNAAPVSLFSLRGAVLGILACANLDRTDNLCLVGRAVSFATRGSAHVTFVNFNRVLTTNAVTLRPYHASAELVEDLKRRLVPGEPQLPLELEGAQAGGLRRHQGRAPEPWRQGRVTRLYDRPGSEGCVLFAATAAQYYCRARLEAVGLALYPTCRTHKAARPPHRFEVLGAGIVVGEHSLKFWKVGRKSAWIHDEESASACSFVTQPDKHGLRDFTGSRKQRETASQRRRHDTNCGFKERRRSCKQSTSD